ncbi:MAG: DUF1634 domain-containing protein [Candidatus Acidiferrales bacterium]
MKPFTWNDRQVEQIVGGLLQFGVSLAGAVVLIGGVLYLIAFAHAPLNYRTFHGEPAGLRGFLPIVSGAFHLDSRAIIQFGLLLLIATPVSRVVFSIAAFAVQRDRTYVVVTVLVLAILLYSLI